MQTSKVYYTNLRTTPTSNLLDKMERLVKKAGITTLPLKNSFVAIKIHFGEPGNLAYIRPNYAARMANLLRSSGAKPFLTDCNTLYSGRRANAVDHLQSAMENGFNPISAQCQVIIGDGLKGTDCKEIALDGEYCKAGCNICVKHCAHDAVHLNIRRKAEIDYNKCIGCGQCVALCQYNGAIMGDEDTSERLNYKIAEYSLAVVKDKPHFHVSFIMNVSPECDCWNHNDAAIIPDLGILASLDPVALDKACADMVIKAPILHSGNRLSEKHEHNDLCGHDKFHLMHPNTNWLAGLEHAEKIGLGTMNYEIIQV